MSNQWAAMESVQPCIIGFLKCLLDNSWKWWWQEKSTILQVEPLPPLSAKKKSLNGLSIPYT